MLLYKEKSRMLSNRDLVQETGLEPTQAFARYHLKVVRLPIPPLLRDQYIIADESIFVNRF